MSRWYRPDGTLSLTREPGAVPSVTTVLARVWPRPALQAWRERQLLELAVACPPGPGQDRSDWVRSIRQSADQYARAAAEEGSRIHADLAEGRIPPGVQTALLLHDIDLRLGRRVLVSRAWLEAQIAALGTAEPGGGSPGPERKGGA